MLDYQMIPALMGLAFQWVVIIVLIIVAAKANTKLKQYYRKPDSKPVKTQKYDVSKPNISPSHTERYLSTDEKALHFLERDDIMDKIKFKLCNSYNNLLLDDSEAVFYHHASLYAKQHYMELLVKARIADIIFVPNLGLNYSGNEILEYSIQNKHFDFVLCKRVPKVAETEAENLVPFLIVEIDGKSHTDNRRITRDDLVDKLIYRVREHGNHIDIIHIRRRTLDDINTTWQTIRYKFGGMATTKSDWLTVNELLDRYTGGEWHN